MSDITDLMSLFGSENTITGQYNNARTAEEAIRQKQLNTRNLASDVGLKELLYNNPEYQQAYVQGNIGQQQQQQALGGKAMMSYEQAKATYGEDKLAKIAEASQKAMSDIVGDVHQQLLMNPTASGEDIVQYVTNKYPEMFNTPQGQKALQQYRTMSGPQLLQATQEFNKNSAQFRYAGSDKYLAQENLAGIKGEYGLAGREISAENQMAMLEKRIDSQYALAKQKAAEKGQNMNMSQYEAMVRRQADAGDPQAKQIVSDLEQKRILARLAGNPAGYKPSVDISKMADIPVKPSPVEQALTATKNAWKQEQGAPKAGIPTQAPSSNVETIQRNLALLEKELKSTPANSDRARILQEEYLTEKQKLTNLGVAQPTPQTPVGTLSTGNTFKIRKTQ